jgi:hypothetical protein
LNNGDEIPNPDEYPEVPNEYPSNPEPLEPDYPVTPEPEPIEIPEPEDRVG